MAEGRIRPSVWVGVMSASIVLAAVVFVLEAPREPPMPAIQETSRDAATAPAPKAPAPARPFPAEQARTRPHAKSPEEPVPYIEGELYGALDLGEVRAALPDNLYWELAAPTKDPDVLEAREQEKIRRNQEYGRVLAGDADEREVDAYYDYRERLSSDYLEFAEYVRRRFGEKLSEQFNGLLDLAIKLNKERLAQIPADRADALARSREHAKIREEWQREQAEFNGSPPDR